MKKYTVITFLFGIMLYGSNEEIITWAEDLENCENMQGPLCPLDIEELEGIEVPVNIRPQFNSRDRAWEDFLVGIEDTQVHCGCCLVIGEEGRMNGKMEAYGTFESLS